MPENHKDQLTLRCPVCFGRENDVTLFEDSHGYYCPKCSFTGTEGEVRAFYAALRKKYRLISQRLTLEEQRRM